MCSYSLHFRMNLIDFLDQHGDNFDKATHGGLAVLRAAIQMHSTTRKPRYIYKLYFPYEYVS